MHVATVIAAAFLMLLQIYPDMHACSHALHNKILSLIEHGHKCHNTSLHDTLQYLLLRAYLVKFVGSNVTKKNFMQDNRWDISFML